MADISPPQLGDIPQQSEFNVPTLSSTSDNTAASAPVEPSATSESTPATSNLGAQAQSAKDTVVNS